MSGFQLPNTTPVPNDIINGWARKLKGSELKVLLIVVRKTLGWILDPVTGMRKEEDWISYSQLGEMTGLGSEALSGAIDALCGKYELIQIRDKNGVSLDTREKRRLAGRRRLSLFYRLNLTTLKNTSHYFENQSSTTSETEDYKSNSLKTTNTKGNNETSDNENPIEQKLKLQKEKGLKKNSMFGNYSPKPRFPEKKKRVYLDNTGII